MRIESGKEDSEQYMFNDGGHTPIRTTSRAQRDFSAGGGREVWGATQHVPSEG